MAKTAWGRDARLYVAPVNYTDGAPDLLDPGALILVTNLKDLVTNDGRKTITATARDLPYDVHEGGGKVVSVETSKLINVDQSGLDVEALQEAFDDGTELWVLVTPKAHDVEAGHGQLLLAELFGWPENLPEDEAGTHDLTFRPSNPDVGFRRVVTPFERHVYEILEGDAIDGDYDIALAGFGTVTHAIGDTVEQRQAATEAAWGVTVDRVRIASVLGGISITILGLGDPAMTIAEDRTVDGSGVTISEV